MKVNYNSRVDVTYKNGGVQIDDFYTGTFWLQSPWIIHNLGRTGPDYPIDKLKSHLLRWKPITYSFPLIFWTSTGLFIKGSEIAKSHIFNLAVFYTVNYDVLKKQDLNFKSCILLIYYLYLNISWLSLSTAFLWSVRFLRLGPPMEFEQNVNNNPLPNDIYFIPQLSVGSQIAIFDLSAKQLSYNFIIE